MHFQHYDFWSPDVNNPYHIPQSLIWYQQLALRLIGHVTQSLKICFDRIRMIMI